MIHNQITHNTVRTAVLLFALMLTTASAWADITGSGTSDAPFVLNTADDWATFASNVNNGTNADKCYKLSDSWNNSDNAVTATVGTNDHPFTGTFDGNGKTLNVSISETSTNGTAPFRYISGGAVIKNVTVAGSVAGTTHAAGLVGFSKDGTAESPNTIENCTVNASITVNTGNNKHMGGVVGHGLNSYLKIKDTVFSGTMTNGGNYAGGLQGWSDGNHLTIDNCISKGSYSGSGTFHPVAIHNTGSTTTATVSAAYYTAAPTLTNTAFIAAAGTQVYTSIPAGTTTDEVTAADGNTYYIVTGYQTITSIATAEDWEAFATSVSAGTNYADMTVRLTQDIEVTTMAGSSQENSFKGTFYGGGHTLTFNATATADNCAPFGYIDGATITCLNVAGTINTGYKYAAGIAAHSYGNCTIQNCRSSVAINTSISGDGTHAGFVAVDESGCTLTITNCLFDGSITGANTTNCGGLVGWRNGTLTFNNCMMAGTMDISQTNGSALFNRNGDSTLNSCYYDGSKSYGSIATQGTSTTATGSDLQTLLGSGWEVSGSSVVPIMDSKNLTTAIVSGISNFYLYTGNEIAVNYTVTAADGTALTKGTHYTETISPATVKDKGYYTLTISGTGSYTGSQTFRFFVGEGTPVTSGTTTMTTGTYVVAEDVTIGSRITVSGDVHLILWDGCTMNATKGINVFSGNSLTIDAQSTGDSMGKLIAKANDRYHAGIGGNLHNNGGAITINGGEITASGADYGAGIGGGTEKGAGTITINGGKVTATGGGWGAGIGSGLRGSCGTITINGGKVTANGGSQAAGIGRGSDGSGGTIQLSYTKAVNSIYASSYGAATMSIAPGKAFADGTTIYTSDTPSSDLLGITGKTLTPANIFNVTVDGCPNTIVTVQDKAVEGETVDFTVNESAFASSNGSVFTVTPATINVTNNGDGNYSFTMPAADVTITAVEWVGSGTQENPYLISNEVQLNLLANRVNGTNGETANDYYGTYFKLGASFTMTGEHTPIGNADNRAFRGIFDGNHQTITGLRINKPNDGFVGLFGYLTNGATVKDLTLADCDITGKYYVGGIAGRTEGGSDNRVTIENCHVSGQNKATVEGANYHGGIVGQAKYTTITGCTVSGTLTGISGVDWGGILGYAGGDVNVTSCENAASITLTGSGTISGVGGITGSTTNFQIEFSNCLNRGTISAGNSHVGAISGTDYTDFFTNCYYTPVNGLKAFGNNSNTSTDAAGHGQPVYAVTAGDNITSLSASPNAAITSTMSGTAYYKAGTYTLTLTPNVPANQEFVRYTCEGGTLDNGDVLLLQVADDTHTLIVSNADVTIGAIVGSPRVNITGDGFTLADIPEQRYRGVAIEPVITLQDGETTLVEGTDYVVVFTNNTTIAPANGADAPTATITGINGYKGTLTRTFTIADFPLQTPGSDNSADNPWLVASEDDLEALASLVNSNRRCYGYYKQTTDITMTREHTAIGCLSKEFTGTYDGGNTAIRNLFINKPDANYQGLFGAVKGAGIIKNIVLENCDITGGDLTGGIAGKMAGKELSNCIVSGAIKVGEGLSADRHGGIAGWSEANIQWCINSASVTGAGSKHGGICGETSTSTFYSNPNALMNSLNTGVVEGTSYVGSIVGNNQISSSSYYNYNYHTSNTTGSLGSSGSTTGTDVSTEDFVFEISAADGLTLTLPTPTYTWGNKSLFNRGTQVTISLTVPEGKYFDRYTVSNGTISNPFIIDGSHQLTGQTGDVVISASLFDGQANLATDASIADIASQTYNGVAYRPLPVVTYDGRTLVKDLHYMVSYSEGCTNADTYTVTVTGMGSYTGQLTKDYVINPFDISTDDAVTVTGVEAEYKQTSYAIHPQPVVTCAALNNATLVEDTDYDLSYSEDCTLPGDYNVILTGKGNYTGVKNVPFTILDEFIDLYVDGDVYTINTTTGWNDFCDALQDLDTYNRFSGKTVKLGNDIEVSRMAGSDSHDFCGTFDGGGNTLTFNYGESGTPASDEYIAPFRYISNTKANPDDAANSPAKIMNLHVKGDIYTSAKYAAGIVGQHWGTLTIENCRSSIVIHSSVVNNDGNDGTHGGIEAVSRGVLNITGCVFDGKIVTTNGTTNCGGFVGWRAANANQTITNSLYAPANIANNETEVGGTENDDCHTFARNWTGTPTNSYYTRTLGTDQGKQAHTITAGDYVTITGIALTGTTTAYTTSGITAYSGGGLSYNDNIICGSSDPVSLTLGNTLNEGYQFNGYVASAGELSGNDTDGYTLTMPDDDVIINANFSIVDWAEGHDGTEDDPYMIYNKEQLDLLASRVNTGNQYRFDEDNPIGYYFKLGADIAYNPDVLTIDNDNDGTNDSNYTPIGTFINSAWLDFAGTFDGDGHTISGIRVYMTDNVGQYQGLFGHVYGGTVKNVTLADARITGNSYVGGIAGYNDYESTISNCHVINVAICANGDYASNVGGIAGYNDYKSTISNCHVVNDAIYANGDDTENFGGIAGINYGTLSNNLVIGATIPATSNNSYGAICGRNKIDNNGSILHHNYYTVCAVAGLENATGVGCVTDDGNDDINLKDIPTFTLGDDTYPDAAVPALRNDADNTYAITLMSTLPTTVAGQPVTYPVALNGRTLWKDGTWNTLCLPFEVTAAQLAETTHPLYGATIMELDVSGTYETDKQTGFDDASGTLYLYFKDATSIEAGKPYIIKWDGDGTNNTVSPVFTGVTIDATTNDVAFTGGNFKGTYASRTFESDDRSILFLGSSNTLTWPKTGARIGAFRAYFDLGSNGTGVRGFSLSFGDDEATGIVTKSDVRSQMSDVWYSLDGKKLDGVPTRKGLYIKNGRKVVIK